MPDLQKIYSARFEHTGLEKRRRVWRILCEKYFDPLIGEGRTVLDLACGYGEFINEVAAARKFAVDLNPDSPKFLDSNVTFYHCPATDLKVIPSDTIDVVFTSNFLEHLRDKDECSRVFSEIHALLRPGGSFIVLGPNIKYAFREYWDYYDHYLPLSHLSLAEGLTNSGFELDKIIPRFLPYTMNSSIPSGDILIKLYLRLPIAWRIIGKQFLIVATKPH